MIEDTHIQINQDFDLILRVNDEGTKYVAYDIFDYKNQEIVLTERIRNESMDKA